MPPRPPSSSFSRSVLGALNVALDRPRLGYGFSGVVLAFYGFLPTALLSFINTQFTDDTGVRHSPLLFFFGATVIGIAALPTSTPQSITITALPGIATIGYGRDLLSDLSEFSFDGFQHATRHDGGYMELAVTAVIIFSCFLVLAFPTDPVKHGYVVNLYEHFLGYCIGYIAPFLTVLAAGLLDYGRGMRRNSGLTSSSA